MLSEQSAGRFLPGELPELLVGQLAAMWPNILHRRHAIEDICSPLSLCLTHPFWGNWDLLNVLILSFPYPYLWTSLWNFRILMANQDVGHHRLKRPQGRIHGSRATGSADACCRHRQHRPIELLSVEDGIGAGHVISYCGTILCRLHIRLIILPVCTRHHHGIPSCYQHHRRQGIFIIVVRVFILIACLIISKVSTVGRPSTTHMVELCRRGNLFVLSQGQI